MSEVYQFWREDNPIYKDVHKATGIGKNTLRFIAIGAAVLIASDQIGKWRTRNVYPEYIP